MVTFLKAEMKSPCKVWGVNSRIVYTLRDSSGRLLLPSHPAHTVCVFIGCK